jgi:hypothetical protein
MTREEFTPILNRLRGLFPCSFPPAKSTDMDSTAAINARALWGGVSENTAADLESALNQYVEHLPVPEISDNRPTFLDTARLISITKRVGRERVARDTAADRMKQEQADKAAARQREEQTARSLARDDNFKGFTDEDLIPLRAEILANPPPIRWPGSDKVIFMNSGAMKYLESVDMRRSPTWKVLVDEHLKRASRGTVTAADDAA